MFDKRGLCILFLLFLMVGTASAVSASDLNQTDTVDELAVDEVVSEDLGDSNVQKTFTDLNNEINDNNKADIYLNHNYTFNPDSDDSFIEGIDVYREVTIWGNGHTIDGKNTAAIFKVSNDNVVFRDIVFTNGNSYFSGSAISGECTAINCNFIGNSAGYGGATYGTDCINCNFIANTARYSGGASCGGSFDNCFFTGNFAHYYGGAIYNGGNGRQCSIVNCRFEENRANVGGAINIVFSDYVTVENCIFIRNSAMWSAGALYSVDCFNCTFTENYAEYGGVMKYGNARNCTFTRNHATFGGAAYQSSCRNCTFTENYADYGGAMYESFILEDCWFIRNYAYLGGALYGTYYNAQSCTFISNSARSGGATYRISTKNCYFENNQATEYGGAVYGETATHPTFKNNRAGISGNDAYNAEIMDSVSSVSPGNNVIYFDAYAVRDGDGSKNNPYKYLYASRLASGVTAYFAEGTYELDSTCVAENVKLIGENARIASKVSNQYDFIINDDSYLELYRITLININILNHGTLWAKEAYFEGNDVFDAQNLPEIESGSGLVDSSFGGVILCDSSGNFRPVLILDGCRFQKVYNAFNGGVIAAVNSDISISNTAFAFYSANYKGGAIYCANSNLNLYNGQFTPFTYSSDEEYASNMYNPYTAYYGGSIYCENSNIFIDRSGFDDSISFSFGGCVAALTSNITVRESNFNNSISLTDGGGAIYNSKSELYIFDSLFKNNTAEFGGAICNINSLLDSFRTTYRDNHANGYGGVIYDIYGTLNFYKNWFYVSHALIGGTMYTRIPNDFVMHYNTFGDSFASEGAFIFYDGKKENVISNYYANDYHVFAEFSAILDGREYYIMSNPLMYQLSSSSDHLYYPYSVREVNDGLVRMKIWGDDGANLTSIATNEVVNNISIDLAFSERFINPKLTVYVFEGSNTNLLFNREYGTNVYAGSRDDVFEGQLVRNYTIDLTDRIFSNDYDFTISSTIDFGHSFVAIKYDNLYEAASFNPVPLINGSFINSSSVTPDLNLLSYYNSNDWGYVSSVKNQRDGGNCWAFSGLATLETCLNKATGVTFDFSVENAKNLMTAYSVYGVKIETNREGYEALILSYLTSWLGPIDETVESYDDYSSISLLENPMFHIQNVKFLPARLNSEDNDLYKLAIWDYGAVSVTFKWGEDYHAVSLVGWDDNYKGKDSLGYDSNGAWIFKNSWGSDWENNGFGYLSYDHKISEQIHKDLHAYTFVFTDNNPYTKIYQYDFAGVSEFYHYNDTIYFKNIFKADNDCLLSAFSTYFDNQTNFTVKVYRNGHLELTQEGTAAAGYYTIPFNHAVQLDKDDEFTILVNNHNKGANCIPVCSAEEITKKTFSQNVSFISLDGVNWYDLYDYRGLCNVACIKAFTQNITLTDIKINVPQFDSVNTKNTNIKVTFDDVNPNALNYCLLKFEIDGETYYAQIRNGVAVLNVNLAEGQHSLSVQYKDNLYRSNVVNFKFTVTHDGSGNSFNSIQDLVNNAQPKSEITLDRNYFYNEMFDDGEYGVHINKTVTINGNGHVIDGLSKATGFYVSADNVVLKNIIFNNTVSPNGGAVYIAARNVTLNNCSFINSKAAQYGGGIYSLFDIDVNNCRFIKDSANVGGGLYLISAGNSNIKNSCFDSNSALKHGSAAYFTGIGTVRVSDTNFTNNAAKYIGGALFIVSYYNNFTNCIFKNNSANSGGALFSSSTSNEFWNCIFSDNLAYSSGGAILVHNDINVYECEFISNTVITDEWDTFGILGGGAIYSFDSLNIHNSTFTNNNASYGGALHVNKFLKTYKSRFINNTAASNGGAIHANNWQMMRSDMSLLLFIETHIYDSYFEDNYAKNAGGAIANANLVKNCTFVKNSAKSGAGAVYEVESIIESRFINNSAGLGGAVYNAYLIDDCTFTDNSASNIAGAIYIGKETYSRKGSLITNSRFTNNYANYSGAIYLRIDEGGLYDVSINVTSCNFSNNHANISGGAMYMAGKILIENSEFYDNSGKYGGAIYMEYKGDYIVRNSKFLKNSALYGGAIDLLGIDDEKSMTHVSFTSCEFANNFANYSGGAIYTDSECLISDSNFANNSARWGSTIYAVGYFDLRNSVIKSNEDAPIRFGYHYRQDNTCYGELNLKNNRIDYEYASVFYGEDEVQCKVPLNLVFNNVGVIKGQYIRVCRFEDEDGNPFAPWKAANLILTLTDQNGRQNSLNLEYAMEFGGYYLNTSSIGYGTYSINGVLSSNGVISSYTVKPGILYVSDESGRTMPVLSSPGLIKTYGQNGDLWVSLKDSYGKPIANTLVRISLNGKVLSVITNANGQASLAVDLPPNTYDAYISVDGNGLYFSSAITSKVVIKKANVKVIAKKKTFKLKTKTKKYAITLKDSYGKALKNVWVKIKIKKKTFKAKTNAKGKATFKLKITKKGNYKANINFAGNAYYNKVTKKVKITVKK